MSNVTLLEIANACAAEFDVSLPQMRAKQYTHASKWRTGDRSPAQIARNIAMWLARRHTTRSIPEIGEFFCLTHRKSASVQIHLGEQMANQSEFAERIERIEEEIDRIHEAKVDRMLAEDEGRAAA